MEKTACPDMTAACLRKAGDGWVRTEPVYRLQKTERRKKKAAPVLERLSKLQFSEAAEN